MTKLAGIEEAGRGPVIGPMVIAIAAVEEDEEFELKSLGIKDSKELSPRRREELFDIVQELCDYEILVVEPEEIDKAVLSEETNLNWLTADKMAQLINSINPEKVIVDCPSHNNAAFGSYLRKKLTVAPKEVIVKHKADRDHTIVGAASILAKVTRDRIIEKIKKDNHITFGSGYPSDPRTRAFINNNYDKYPIFRKSWSTWQKAADRNKQKGLGDYSSQE